jgi:hypothetical protein
VAAMGALGVLLPNQAAACGHTPRDAIVRYYHAVDAKRFKTAWSCLRNATRQAFGGYEHWRSGYRRTRYTRLRSATVTDQAAGLGHVQFTIDSCRAAGGEAIRERISGTWFAENGPAGWRIGEPRARVIRTQRSGVC